MTHLPRTLLGPFTRALILERPDPHLDDYLAEIGIESTRIDEALSESDLVELLEREPFHLIYKRSRTQISRRVIEAGKHLHGIMLCCVGDDSVDKQAAADHGVLVQNDPISNGRSVVELVMGELVVLARRLFEAHAETNAHRFVKQNAGRYELAGRVLGVFGLGNIGKQVAQQATSFGMEVIFHDTREVAVEVGEAMGWRSVDSVEELFAQSNAVTVHTSAEDAQGRSNENVLDASHFAALGRDVESGPRIFINAGRGFLYRPEDLISAVESGQIESAFVDVFPEEPKSANDTWRNPYADTERRRISERRPSRPNRASPATWR